MSTVYGLDFGTSNSAIALSNGSDVKMIPVGPKNEPMINSVVFFPEGETGFSVGLEAIEQYFETGMDGRLIQSIKSALPSQWLRNIIIRRKVYKLENIVALILSHLKKRADNYIGHNITRVVIGRPAIFSPDPEKEMFATERLINSAKMAGFTEIHLLPEPIAAALSYETQLQAPETVLVVDSGGGTTDFTIMELSPEKSNHSDRSSDILGSNGLRVAGDNFDTAIMWHKLIKYFGSGTTYMSLNTRMPMPINLLKSICEWRKIYHLKSRKEREFISGLLVTSDNKEAIKRLYALIEDDLGFALFRAIESAKCSLSDTDKTEIKFNIPPINIQESIDRSEFDAMVAPKIEQLDECLEHLLNDIPISRKQISSIFLTGGTSQAPCIKRWVADKFGEEKVRSRDAFLSVASGLALSAKLFF